MAELKLLARRIFQETISAIDIPEAMQRKLLREGAVLRFDRSEVDLHSFTSARVIAVGKAAHAMAEGLTKWVGGEFSFTGIVCAPAPPARLVAGLKYF